MDLRKRNPEKDQDLSQSAVSSVSSESTTNESIDPNSGLPEEKKRFPANSHALAIHKIVSPRVLLTLAAAWILLIHIVERVRVQKTIDVCRWDKWENWPQEKSSVTPHRVALIADPQLVDDHTYPKLPRFMNYLIRRMSDNYLYVNYKYLQQSLDPDTTIFIGDLFDGGRDWDDAPWTEEYERFCRIFPENPRRQSFRGLPGNHDIGFQTISPAKVARFAAHFGRASAAYTLGNHTFVQLDTISLSHEDPNVHSAPRAFLEKCKAELDHTLPKIVLTHVPLYRDPQIERCAAGRESKNPFPLMRGVEYQTVIDFPYTEDILKNLGPVMVFSGDDHDYCDMTHVDYSDNSRFLAREISCKTISMTNGIRHPAVQLISLNNPQDGTVSGKTFETTMCYLPSPYLGVRLYMSGLFVSFVALYIWIMRPQTVVRLLGASPFSVRLSSSQRKVALAVHWGAQLAFVLTVLACYNPM